MAIRFNSINNGRKSSTGSTYNTGLGDGVFNGITSGTQNVAIGNSCMQYNNTNNSTGVGSYCLINSGANSTGVGCYCLYNNNASGTGCTGVGYYAGQKITSGTYNTAIGTDSLKNVVTGAYNTALGYSAGSALTLTDSSNIDIGNVGVVGENNVIRIGTYGTGNGQQNRGYIAGVISEPNQPAFEAYVSSTITNVTGDGTVYTVIFDTEDFDQNADYNNGTGVFTAPVTGKYFLSATVHMTEIDVNMTTGNIEIVTTGRVFANGAANFGAIKSVNNIITLTVNVVANLAAGNTAYVTVAIANSGKTADVQGHASYGYSYFSGHLIC